MTAVGVARLDRLTGDPRLRTYDGTRRGVALRERVLPGVPDVRPGVTRP